jgi:uncharacterized protein (UPF0303 family)
LDDILEDRFPSLEELLAEEAKLTFNPATLDPLALGSFVSQRIAESHQPLSLIIRQFGRTVFQVAHPGSELVNDSWMIRKARVSELFGHSSLYVRLEHEATGRPFETHRLNLNDFAFFGGGYPLKDQSGRTFGAIGASGTLQLHEHKFLVEALMAFKV